jgi:hypothetical protein
MAYNHRMSQQFHGSQQQNRNRKKDDDSDALMRLVNSVATLFAVDFHADEMNSRTRRLQDVSTILVSPSARPTC